MFSFDKSKTTDAASSASPASASKTASSPPASSSTSFAGGIGGLPSAASLPPLPPSSSSSSASSSSPSSASPATSSTSSSSSSTAPNNVKPAMAAAAAGSPVLGPGGLPMLVQPAGPLGFAAPPMRERHWGEKLVYEIGSCYAVGFLSGGLIGLMDATRAPSTGPTTPKLRFNAILNSTSRTSAKCANSFGVFALLYSMNRTLYESVREPEPDSLAPDVFGATVAGTLMARVQVSGPASVILGSMVGGFMYFALKARRDHVDGRGKRLHNF